MKTGPKTLPLEVRFLKYVNKTETCWNWTGGKSPEGYGRFGIGVWKNVKIKLAHRVGYELFKGEIPLGLTLDHLCLNTLCVNPDHLEPVTLSENSRRAVIRRAPASCPRGHIYDKENAKRRPDGSLYCRRCNNNRAREYRLKRRVIKNERIR